MADLAYVLRQLPPNTDPNLLVGKDPADDAAVYRLSDDVALVQTVDFFTPIVDDPYTFGWIAAANSMSDVYAMGGEPRTALNIVAFPFDSLSPDVLAAILRGGSDAARQAGVAVVGGHTIDDPEPKYGLAVTGIVDPRAVVTAHGAQPGDLLVLTKPLGSGVISTALKAGAAHAGHAAAAVRWMSALSADASRAMRRAGAHASTDITGYGLLGHLSDMCLASGAGAILRSSAVPLLPGALDYARQGYLSRGSRSNLDAVRARLAVDDDVDPIALDLLADAQTSGGLLIALDPGRLDDFRAGLSPSTLAPVVGEVLGAEAGRLRVAA